MTDHSPPTFGWPRPAPDPPAQIRNRHQAHAFRGPLEVRGGSVAGEADCSGPSGLIERGAKKRSRVAECLQRVLQFHQIYFDAQNCDVMAIWVDRVLVGQTFLIHAVPVRDGQAEQFAAYRLWVKPGGFGSLVPSRGEGPTIAITRTGLLLKADGPWSDEIDRITCISLG